MSDIQDPLTVLQHRAQQRQILAMMGINQWIQPESKTINIADIAMDMKSQSNAEYLSIDQPSTTLPNTEYLGDEYPNVGAPSAKSVATEMPINVSIDTVRNMDEQFTETQTINEQNPVTYSFDRLSSDTPDNANATVSPANRTASSFIDEAVQSATAPVLKHHVDQNTHNESQKKVAPFTLQGGRYGDWVILVDIQALTSDSQKLWQNITSALSISCETTSFPICEGMDTAELANASLAGYVFRMGRSEEIKVAALTVLPDGIEHPTLTVVPTLDDMLEDSSLKRKLWNQISL
ncbi:hypothetical protein [Psychrobacter sp. NG27]|uniref:hypothetical protein n=1 Tax=Psychrobacter sp. NG27 TaxID=2781966 RepID=UPI0018DF6D47|nr:hypothetical protein [Psychrobacter sp. NG27]MBI0426388.1 hypothetical protein [Psychrobacter sp. NG27]